MHEVFGWRIAGFCLLTFHLKVAAPKKTAVAYAHAEAEKNLLAGSLPSLSKAKQPCSGARLTVRITGGSDQHEFAGAFDVGLGQLDKAEVLYRHLWIFARSAGQKR